MKSEISEVIDTGDNENGVTGESNGGMIDDEQVQRQGDEQE